MLQADEWVYFALFRLCLLQYVPARKQLAIGNDLNCANFKIRDPLPGAQIYAFAAKRFLKALKLKFISIWDQI